MTFIIEENCYNIDAINNTNPIMLELLDQILNASQIKSLDYFVIADSDDQNFRKAIDKYASIVGTGTDATQDETYLVAGKCLDGIDRSNNLHQAIIIKSSVWVCAAMGYGASRGLFDESILGQNDSPALVALALVLHEIGHAIDNEHQMTINGTINTKVLYNLDYEYDEYAKYTALSLWGEYYAESFAYKIIQSKEDLTKDKEVELENCILNYSIGNDRNTLINRVYRILYFFVIRIAFLHRNSNFSCSFNYSKFESNDLLRLYIPFLAKAEIAIVNLLRNYPNWNSYECLKELSNIFTDLINFEYNRQA